MPPKAALPGRYRIVEMEEWDQDYVDTEVEGFFSFSTSGDGEFRFGCVHGFMDCRFEKRDGRPAVEFSWEGSDEGDPAQGRGWAVLEGDTLTGRLYFHQGDDSAFVARRQASVQPGHAA